MGLIDHAGTATPKSDAALEHWEDFCKEIRTRLVTGKREYGDSSFERSLPRILSEIQDELKDVCGWSFILHRRIEELRKVLTE